VLLYVPNIIGYLRIALSATAFFHWTAPAAFACYYSAAFVLDAADGLAARALGQASHFGGLLDMLTDRCATAALLVVISAVHRPAAKVALPLAFLDGYSHYLQFAATLCSSAESHKAAGRGRVLQLYYWRPVLTFVCTLNEFAFIAYFMIVSGAPGPVLLPALLPAASAAHLVFYLSLPVCAFKQAISVRQIFSAHYTIRDAIAAASKTSAASAAQ
jgi:CDP-diacylglycerol--inositol 3-phosphatidyltransferase